MWCGSVLCILPVFYMGINSKQNTWDSKIETILIWMLHSSGMICLFFLQTPLSVLQICRIEWCVLLINDEESKSSGIATNFAENKQINGVLNTKSKKKKLYFILVSLSFKANTLPEPLLKGPNTISLTVDPQYNFISVNIFPSQ